MKLFKIIILATFVSLLSPSQLLANEDQIIELTVQDKIGYEEVPMVNVEVKVTKQRELYVAVVDMANWQTIKRTQKRIKKSGKYHFKLAIEGLKAGQYRVDAYLAPRRKGWNDRITEPTQTNFDVINKPKRPKKSEFSKQDKINNVTFPKQVVGLEEVTLTVQYDITQPRELHIKLLDSGNWKEFGALKFPVNKTGEISVPLSNMTEDFPASKYAWVVFLSEKGKVEPLGKKQGKHFELKVE